MLTNLITNDKYVGQSIDLGKRFTKHFSLRNFFIIKKMRFLNKKNNALKNSLVISRALIKYGYSNFTISVLEYCERANLNEREQYHMDLLKPVYNTLKVAGSSSGYKHSQESKDKTSGAKVWKVFIQVKSLLSALFFFLFSCCAR